MGVRTLHEAMLRQTDENGLENSEFCNQGQTS